MKKKPTLLTFPNFTLLILLILFCFPTFSQINGVGKHPVLYLDAEEREILVQKIETEAWAQQSWNQLLLDIDPYVTRHQMNPEWIVSRLAMYWKDGERYTQCYIKNQDWNYGEGNAPVPTVRLPGMRRWNDYKNVSLKDRTSYNETGDMWGVSKSSGDTARVLIPYKETGHMIRSNNKEILELAEKSAFAYYLTEEEKYAKFSSDILQTWLLGIYYMQPPLDPEKSTKGPGGYAPGGIMGYYDYEVIHDDRQLPAATAYDFLHHYLQQNPNEELGRLGISITDLAGTVFKRFIEIGLVRGGAKGNWNVNRYRHLLNSMLVLESNDFYADGKGKEYYIPYYTEISREYHDALPEIIKNYDLKTGLWPESPGYASGMIGAVLEMAMPLYKSGVNTLGENPMIQKAAMANLGWLDPRGNLVVFGDMRGGSLDYGVFEKLYTYYSWEQDNENATIIATVLNKGLKSGQHDRSKSDWRSIVLNQPLKNASSTLPYNRAAYSPHHRHIIMKNENDEDNGMMFTLYGGKKGGHLSQNGLAWQFYGKGWSLAPDASAYESYWSKDIAYHRYSIGSNTIIQGYQKGDITVNAMDPFVPSDQLYNEVLTSTNCSFADVSADEKRRLIAMVRTSASTGYYVDIFRSDLDNNDYLHHSLGNEQVLKNAKGEVLTLNETKMDTIQQAKYSFFENAKKISHTEDFWSSWTIDKVSPAIQVDMWMMGQAGRELYQVDAPPTTLRPDITPGQINKAPGKTPMLLVRQSGNNASKSPFVGVFEAFEAGDKSIERITTLATSDTFVSIEVTSTNSRQYIYNATDDELYTPGKKNAFKGIFGVASVKGKSLEYLYLGEGKLLNYGDYQIEAIDAPVNAELRLENGEFYYSSDKPIRITLQKGKAKEYSSGYNVLID